MAMPAWKQRLFARVVSRRMEEEGKMADEILAEYPALTQEEKQTLKQEKEVVEAKRIVMGEGI